MLAGIRDIIIITSPREEDLFRGLFHKDKTHFGLNIEFATQQEPNGLPEAFLIAKKVLEEKGIKDDYDQFVLILGDNIFYGAGFGGILENVSRYKNRAQAFLQRVKDPTRFGVVSFDAEGEVVDILEKPLVPPSNYAVTGLYAFPANVLDRAGQLKKSTRGELEITDLIRLYHHEGTSLFRKLHRGISWFDTGTPDSMLEAAGFVKTIQDHQGFLVGSPQEIAYRYGWITKENVLDYIKPFAGKNPYGSYLEEMVYGYHQ